MKVALMVTCVNDAMFPEVGQAVVRLLRRLGVDVEFPDAQTCCGQPMVNTGYLRRGGARRARLRRRLRRLRRDHRPVRARASGRCATSTRSWPAGPGDAALVDGAARTVGGRPRAERVPRGRPRRGGRGRLLPAPGDLPPDLPLAADARRGRPPDAAAPRGPGDPPGGAAGGRAVLRLRGHLRGEEPRHVGGHGGRQGAPRARHRRRGDGRRGQLVPDARRRHPVATARRRAGDAPGRGAGRHRERAGVPAARGPRHHRCRGGASPESTDRSRLPAPGQEQS